MSDISYVYLGWVARTEREGLALLDEYQKLDLGNRDTDIQVQEGQGTLGGSTIYRIREGVERFLITDIGNPASSAIAQSSVPVMWEWTTNHSMSSQPGGHVLYMDGHVEWVPYPGKFPMTPTFQKRLSEISALDNGAP